MYNSVHYVDPSGYGFLKWIARVVGAVLGAVVGFVACGPECAVAGANLGFALGDSVGSALEGRAEKQSSSQPSSGAPATARSPALPLASPTALPGAGRGPSFLGSMRYTEQGAAAAATSVERVALRLRAAYAGDLGQPLRELLSFWTYESVLPGPYGQPLSQWGASGPAGWGDPMGVTEAAGGAWQAGERAAVGLAGALSLAALGVGATEYFLYGNQSFLVGFRGGELTLEIAGNKFFRLNPFGDWTSSHRLARRPHYHRRPIKGPAGKGQGIKWHRPWEGGW